jgi:hypothetical protein
MSKTSNKLKIEVLRGWVQWASRQKGYPKKKVKVKNED